MNDRARWGLLALALLLLFGGVVGALVYEDTDGSSDGSALSTSTTSDGSGSTGTSASGDTSTTATTASTGSSTSTPTSTAPTTATPSTPSTELPRNGSGSGLGSSGTGDIAAGTGPTPQTGPPGWVVVAGTVALLLGMATRRLSAA